VATLPNRPGPAGSGCEVMAVLIMAVTTTTTSPTNRRPCVVIDSASTLLGAEGLRLLFCWHAEATARMFRGGQRGVGCAVSAQNTDNRSRSDSKFAGNPPQAGAARAQRPDCDDLFRIGFLESFTAKALALATSPRQAGQDALSDHRPLELREHAHHLEHGAQSAAVNRPLIGFNFLMSADQGFRNRGRASSQTATNRHSQSTSVYEARTDVSRDALLTSVIAGKADNICSI
jgi:hypothetical protein